MAIEVGTPTGTAFDTPGSATATVSAFDPGSGSDRLIIVCVNTEDNASDYISSIAWDPGTANKAFTKVLSEEVSRAQTSIWYLKDADLGGTTAKDVAVTSVAEIQFQRVIIFTLTGVDQTTPVGNSIGAQNTSAHTALSATINVGTTNSIVISALANGSAALPSVDGAQTELESATVSSFGSGVGWEIFSSTGNQTQGFTSSSVTRSVLALAEFKEASGGGGGLSIPVAMNAYRQLRA